MNNYLKRLFSLFLVFVLLVGTIPASAAGQTLTPAELLELTGSEGEFPQDDLPTPITGDENPYEIATLAYDYDDIPEEMLNNYLLDALAFTGYDVDYLKSKELLYKSGYYGSSLNRNAPDVLSDIDYGSSNTGTEYVTSTGLPNISKFESGGLDCTGFGAYFYFNYLYRVADISSAQKTRLKYIWDNFFRVDGSGNISSSGSTARRAVYWHNGGQAAVDAGYATQIGTSDDDLEDAQIGDLRCL